VWLAFGSATPRIPIHDPFVRWELLNGETCFTVLVAVTSMLALRTRTAAPLVALAVPWTVDAAFLIARPMPLPTAFGWLVVPVDAMFVGLAVLCWVGSRER
jgi:hypothetical protein